jgi:hypothetical protein
MTALAKILEQLRQVSVAWFLLVWCGLATATSHALLIGVSDYPQLPKRLWLQGPVNDARLMREVLMQKGIAAENIQTLTSRSAPEDDPTRLNILRAFARLKSSVKPGDRVFFFMAGHGSQQPQPVILLGSPTEADGLDEVFLPSDVHQWSGVGTHAAIPNAILDDEIGSWMDSLVDAGASVWGVFDTCHAAGMTRGKAVGGRAISAADLGIPISPVVGGSKGQRTPLVAAVQRLPGARMDGRSLAFASRSHELTGEEWLPRGAALANSRRHGIFTFHLADALRNTKSLNATNLQKAVGDAYARERRISPVPQWFGDASLLWP